MAIADDLAEEFGYDQLATACSERETWKRRALAAENHASNLAADNKELVRERDEARAKSEYWQMLAGDQ